MFVAGIIGGVVVGALAYDDHSNYSDYSDHSNYSRYSDAHMTARIRQKENEIEQLRKRVRASIQGEVDSLKEHPDIGPLIAGNVSKGNLGIDQLSCSAIDKLEENLESEISKDEKELQDIDKMIQKINNMTLAEKS